MERNPTWIAVVAVAMRAESGRWLFHRRPPGKHHAGLWEFPGGKIEPGETPCAALVREVNEELGVSLDPRCLQPAGFAEAEAQDGRPGIVILLYIAPPPAAEPRALEGGELGWFTLAEAAALAKPPLDEVLLRQLVRAADRAEG